MSTIDGSNDVTWSEVGSTNSSEVRLGATVVSDTVINADGVDVGFSDVIC